MTSNANVSLKMRYKVCNKALQTVRFLDRLTAVTHDGKIATQYKHWIRNVPSFVSKFCTWGEASVIK